LCVSFQVQFFIIYFIMAALFSAEVCAVCASTDMLVQHDVLVCLCRFDASQITQPQRSHSSYPQRGSWQKCEELKNQYASWIRQLKGCVRFSVSFSNPGLQLFDSLRASAVAAIVTALSLHSLSVCPSRCLYEGHPKSFWPWHIKQ